jgi:hypothetical protein
MAAVRTSSAVRQNGGNEQALVDFGAAAVALEAPILDRKLTSARHQAGHDVCRGGHKPLDPNVPAAPVGE